MNTPPDTPSTTPTRTRSRPHIPALRTTLHLTSAHHSPPTAGIVLARFTFLTAYLATHPPSPSPSPHTHSIWTRVINGDIPPAIRTVLQDVDLDRLIPGLRDVIERVRDEGYEGDELAITAGARVAGYGIGVLYGREPDEGVVGEVLGFFGGVMDAVYAAEMFCLTERVGGKCELGNEGSRGEGSDGGAGIGGEKAGEEAACAICTETLGETAVRLKSCGHVFCKECLAKWVFGSGMENCRKCPMCRTSIDVGR